MLFHSAICINLQYIYIICSVYKYIHFNLKKKQQLYVHDHHKLFTLIIKSKRNSSPKNGEMCNLLCHILSFCIPQEQESHKAQGWINYGRMKFFWGTIALKKSIYPIRRVNKKSEFINILCVHRIESSRNFGLINTIQLIRKLRKRVFSFTLLAEEVLCRYQSCWMFFMQHYQLSYSCTFIDNYNI